MVFVITAKTKKDSQAAHTDFTRSVYMESDTQPDNQTVLKKWKQNTVTMLMKARWRSSH
jgi:hypothetical protein